MIRLVPVFDLDGTLVDSDAALRAPFAALGVDPDSVPLGLPLAAACDLAGLRVDDYLAAYDGTAVRPFPGVDDLLDRLDRWAVCSNKARASGVAELTRLGWVPEVALFSDDFAGRPKELLPVLEAMRLTPAEAVFIGDTDHDRTSARAAGAIFALAGWNPRPVPEPDDVVLGHPLDVLALLGC